MVYLKFEKCDLKRVSEQSFEVPNFKAGQSKIEKGF